MCVDQYESDPNPTAKKAGVAAMSPIETDDQQHRILATALRMLALDITPLPVKADGSKRPAVDTWKAYADGTQQVTEGDVRRWFTDESSGLGAIMGSCSSGLEMLEFEGGAVAKYQEFTRVIVASNLELVWKRITEGYTERTPRGGYHWLYRISDAPVPGNQKVAMRPGAKPGELDTLAETRGQGGFVVLAPTSGSFHANGKPWELRRGGIETIATITMAERNAIHECMTKALDETPPVVAKTYEPRDPNHDDAPGDVFNARASWADMLQADGWTPGITRGDKQFWTRPGKNDGGTSATLGYEGTDTFYPFTTSTVLPAFKGLDKFGYFARWHHGGDFSAAAKACRAAGYYMPQAEWDSRNGFKIAASARPKDDEAVVVGPVWNDHKPPLVNLTGEKFPIDIMHPDYANLARAMDEAGTPAEYFALPALAAQSALLVAKGSVKMGRRVQQLGLYINVVGDPSEGKSTGYTEAMAPVVAHNERVELARETKFKSSKARLDGSVKEVEDARREKPMNTFRVRAAEDALDALMTELQVTSPTWKEHYRTLSNCGTEALLKIVKEQKCNSISYVHDEGGLFEIWADTRGTGLLSFDTFAGAWDGATAHRHRAGSAGAPGDSFMVKNFRMSICVMSQPGVLKRAMENETLISKGLLPRFVIVRVPPRSTQIDDDELDYSAEVRAYTRNVESQAEWLEKADPFTIEASHLQASHWNPWRRNNVHLYEGPAAIMPKAVARRLEQSVLRLAAHLHFQHGYRLETMSAEILERALVAGRMLFSEAAALYGPTTQQGSSEVALRIVRTITDGTLGRMVTISDLDRVLKDKYRGRPPYEGVADIYGPLQWLVDHGIAAMYDGDNNVRAINGRKSRTITFRVGGFDELMYQTEAVTLTDLPVMTSLAPMASTDLWESDEF